jgi:hypothetical protein
MPAVAGPTGGGKADEIHIHGAPGQITTCAALGIGCQHMAVGRRILEPHVYMGGPQPSFLGIIGSWEWSWRTLIALIHPSR